MYLDTRVEYLFILLFFLKKNIFTRTNTAKLHVMFLYANSMLGFSACMRAPAVGSCSLTCFTDTVFFSRKKICTSLVLDVANVAVQLYDMVFENVLTAIIYRRVYSFIIVF